MSDEISIEEKARRYDMMVTEHARWCDSAAYYDSMHLTIPWVSERLCPMMDGWTQEEADEHLKEWLGEASE